MCSIGCKSALRLAERAISTALNSDKETSNKTNQIDSLKEILDDLQYDLVSVGRLCEIR